MAYEIELELLAQDLAHVVKSDKDKLWGIAVATGTHNLTNYALLLLNQKGTEQAEKYWAEQSRKERDFWHETQDRMRRFRICQGQKPNGNGYLRLEDNFEMLDEFLEDRRYFLVGKQNGPAGFIAVLTPININCTSQETQEYVKTMPRKVIFFPE